MNSGYKRQRSLAILFADKDVHEAFFRRDRHEDLPSNPKRRVVVVRLFSGRLKRQCAFADGSIFMRVGKYGVARL